MFRDLYHQANDDIKINQELLSSILESAPKKNKYFYPRITTAASVFILAAAILAYPGIKNSFSGGDINSEPPKITVGAATNTNISKQAEPASCPPEPTNVPVIKAGDTNSDKNAADNISKDNAASNIKKAQQSKPTPKNSAPAACCAEIEDNTSAESNLTNDETPAVINNEESPSLAEANNENLPAVMGLTSDEQTRDTLVTEIWTTERYFEYLGKPVLPELPEDLMEVTVSEKNMTLYSDSKLPCFDSWSLKYESLGAERKASVKMTKNIETAEENISNSSNIINIDGVNISLICNDTKMLAKGIKDGVYYIIEAEGLTSPEFENLYLSIFK